MKDEVKVCLIGSGRAGMIHGHNFAGSVPGGKIIAVCDPVGDVAENAAKELGIDLFYKEYLINMNILSYKKKKTYYTNKYSNKVDDKWN